MTKNTVDLVKLFAGVAAVFALFNWVAGALGSMRGEYGVVIGIAIVSATLLTRLLLFGGTFVHAGTELGLSYPSASGLLIAAAISVLLLLTIPIFSYATGAGFTLYSGWPWLLPGLFMQAGVAEETLFRGFLFGHIRREHAFWKAAVIATVPFVVVHLFLFYTVPFPLAVASIVLSVAVSFPLARFYELGGYTVWAPAVLHFVTQGAIKIFIPNGEMADMFPIVWMAAACLIPFAVFAFGPGHQTMSAERFRN